MQQALTQPAESSLWLPPRRMRQYAVARVMGGVLFAAIFAGWVALQWSNVTMRVIGGLLIVLTAWVTAASIQADAKRMRGRQVECDGQVLIVMTPEGLSRVRLSDVQEGTWTGGGEEFGLSFVGKTGETLARLDENIIADEAEARVFLRWLRTRTDTIIEVKWT